MRWENESLTPRDRDWDFEGKGIAGVATYGQETARSLFGSLPLHVAGHLSPPKKKKTPKVHVATRGANFRPTTTTSKLQVAVRWQQQQQLQQQQHRNGNRKKTADHHFTSWEKFIINVYNYNRRLLRLLFMLTKQHCCGSCCFIVVGWCAKVPLYLYGN